MSERGGQPVDPPESGAPPSADEDSATVPPHAAKTTAIGTTVDARKWHTTARRLGRRLIAGARSKDGAGEGHAGSFDAERDAPEGRNVRLDHRDHAGRDLFGVVATAHWPPTLGTVASLYAAPQWQEPY